MQASHYFKEYSPSLGRDMEFEVYGFGGKPCIVFPCQNGRFFDYNSFKMTDAAAAWINEGNLQLFCVDSVDIETWSDVDGDPRRRGEMLEKWYHYIADELVPRIREINGTPENVKLMVTGCSMGASHAGIFALRRPDLFDGLRAAHLEPKRMTLVQATYAAAPSMVLVEAVKYAAPGMIVTPALCLWEPDPNHPEKPAEPMVQTSDTAYIYENCGFPPRFTGENRKP